MGVSEASVSFVAPGPEKRPQREELGMPPNHMNWLLNLVSYSAVVSLFWGDPSGECEAYEKVKIPRGDRKAWYSPGQIPKRLKYVMDLKPWSTNLKLCHRP